MSFPENVAVEALTSCERCCCICHKFCGTKIELHHIEQQAYGGKDTLENCIPLCFDCHADMGKADPKHPKGKKYSIEELKRHRDNWYKKVKNNTFGGNDNKKIVFREDAQLFKKICDMFNPSVKHWLITESIEGAHPFDVFMEFDQYLYNAYKDPFSEFINPELEKMRGNLISAIKEFLTFKSINTFVKNVCGQQLCVTHQWLVNHDNLPLPSKQSEECLARFEQEAKTLDELATRLWETYCEFVRQGRLLLLQEEQIC